MLYSDVPAAAYGSAPYCLPPPQQTGVTTSATSSCNYYSLDYCNYLAQPNGVTCDINPFAARRYRGASRGFFGYGGLAY
jgi:hypothetical protein